MAVCRRKRGSFPARGTGATYLLLSLLRTVGLNPAREAKAPGAPGRQTCPKCPPGNSQVPATPGWFYAVPGHVGVV